MSIINEALKKAAEKKSRLLDFDPSPPEQETNRIFEVGEVQKEVRPKKQWLIWAIAGCSFTSLLIAAILFGRNLFVSNSYLGQEVNELTLLPKETKVVKPTPLPVAREPRKKFVKVKLPSLYLNGIMQGRGKPLAIVNGRVVNVGDSIQGATVVKINPDSVNLVYQDQEFVLRLK